MAQGAGSSSTQCSIQLNLNSTLQDGTLFQLQTSAGDSVLSFAKAKRYQTAASPSPVS